MNKDCSRTSFRGKSTTNGFKLVLKAMNNIIVELFTHYQVQRILLLLLLFFLYMNGVRVLLIKSNKVWVRKKNLLFK